MKIRPILALILPVSLAVFGCSKDKPGTTATAPSASNAQPATAASKPAMARAGSQPAVAASQPAAKTDPFSGLVKFGEGISEKDIKPTDVLYIMARQAMGPGQAGRLVAVQRHAPVKLPLRYEMTSKNLMMPGVPFAGPFIVRARLDRDGDPMTKGADDLYAEFSKSVANGDDTVHLTLSKRAMPAKGAASSRPASQPAK
ncbi:MAG: hypothetical protein VYC39_17870 [Myxococcota bacterium]|nr:hypothetical protein [Myxococcota bacterium]